MPYRPILEPSGLTRTTRRMFVMPTWCTVEPSLAQRRRAAKWRRDAAGVGPLASGPSMGACHHGRLAAV